MLPYHDCSQKIQCLDGFCAKKQVGCVNTIYRRVCRGRAAVPVPWIVSFFPRMSWLMNLGINFSGYWCGPNTLFPRVMTTGRLNDLTAIGGVRDSSKKQHGDRETQISERFSSRQRVRTKANHLARSWALPLRHRRRVAKGAAFHDAPLPSRAVISSMGAVSGNFDVVGRYVVRTALIWQRRCPTRAFFPTCCTSSTTFVPPPSPAVCNGEGVFGHTWTAPLLASSSAPS